MGRFGPGGFLIIRYCGPRFLSRRMNHRPTIIERAYQLARSGEHGTLSSIKQQLSAEGHERVQEHLYGGTLSAALRKLCQAHYVAPVGETVTEPDDDD